MVNFFNDLTERKRQGAERERLLQEAQTRSAELQEARDELESKIERRTIALRQLSSKLIHVQDEERRRIARELHDSIGQYLAALGMGLAQLGNGNAFYIRSLRLDDFGESNLVTRKWSFGKFFSKSI